MTQSIKSSNDVKTIAEHFATALATEKENPGSAMDTYKRCTRALLDNYSDVNRFVKKVKYRHDRDQFVIQCLIDFDSGRTVPDINESRLKDGLCCLVKHPIYKYEIRYFLNLIQRHDTTGITKRLIVTEYIHRVMRYYFTDEYEAIEQIKQRPIIKAISKRLLLIIVDELEGIEYDSFS